MVPDIQRIVPWETLIYAHYLARGETRLFDAKWVKKHGTNGLSLAFINGSSHMPRRKKNADGNRFSNNLTWCNVTLPDDAALHIESWDVTDDELFAGILELVDTGHALFHKAAADGEGFTFGATGHSDECINRGLGMSGYADNPRDAVKVFLYKHFTLCDRSWPKPSSGTKLKFR